MSEQLGKLVGDELGARLWMNGMMNELRRYPNEIPCEPGEIPSMILPSTSGFDKVEWGFTAGMSCLVPNQDGSITVRNAEHFPASAVLALLSLLYDAGAAERKKITVSLVIPQNPRIKPFLDLLNEAEKKLSSVTIKRLPGEENVPCPEEKRTVADLESSMFVVRSLNQTDIGRFAAEVVCVSGSIRVGDDLTVTDGDFTVLQEHCPVTLIVSKDNQKVRCSDDLDDDDFFVCFAMWFPPDFPPISKMFLIKESQTPPFTPVKMPPAAVIRPEPNKGLFSWLKKH
jgi:hypothetical protein